MSKHLTHITAVLFLLVASLSAQTDSWPCGASGSDLTCTRTGDTLTVTGTGAMRDYIPNATGITAPWGKVSNVIIGEGVTYIGSLAFSGNLGKLKEVVVSATEPPSVGNNAFDLNPVLRVPEGSITAYQSKDVWKDFAYINPSIVTYRTQNDIVADTATLVSYGNLAKKPAPDPIRTGFTFGGWYKQGEEATYDFSTPVTSDITLLAKWNSTTSTASPDRVIPQGKPADEAAAVAPAGKSTAEFTAGPNPASRSSGGVAFFRQGTLIVNASLSVYDASGNVVRALSIRDNAVGTQSKRRVGSWDLKDANGRLVPGGTYLVKGTITAAGGKSQSVSVLVGVK